MPEAKAAEAAEAEATEGSDKGSGRSCCYVRKRFIVCFMCFLGMLIIHAMRVNIAITVVTILDDTPHDKVADGHAQELPDVDWSPTMVGVLHSVFYVGFLITQIPAGYLATKIPSNRIFSLCILLSCSLNLLVPSAIANMGFISTCCVRVLQGLLEGAVIPALYKIIHDWSPNRERNSFAAFAITGMYAGAIVGFPLDGLLTHYVNWQYVFYVHGASGFVWFAFWFLLVYEKPEFDPSVRDAERELILAGRDEVVDMNSIPWRAIMSSTAVWAIVVCHFVRSWMFFFLLTNEPAYLNTFEFSIIENGIFSAMPHLLKVICCFLAGMLADILRAKCSFSITSTRKFFTCFGFGVEAICCYALSRVETGHVAIVFLNIGVGCSGFTVAGWQVNHLDLAPQFASVLVGISATFGTVGGILSPIVIGIMTHPQTLWNWQKSFILTGSVLAVGVVFYFFTGSAELQPWAKRKESSDDASENTQLKATENTDSYDSFAKPEDKADRDDNNYGKL